jgi:phosphatidylethanolamine-binding protein (PEBP) family uncharacterized protein
VARMIIAAIVALAWAGPAFAQGFKLESPDIKPAAPIAEEQVFNGFGCTGKNISPALRWSGAPNGTQSFALLVHDPDAPTGLAGWWHLDRDHSRRSDGSEEGRGEG